MKNKMLKYVGIVMMIVAVIFVIVAFNNPEFAWPWSNTITCIIYGTYLITMCVTFITGQILSNKEMKNKNKEKVKWLKK
jgi:uncharacterized membrane protein